MTTVPAPTEPDELTFLVERYIPAGDVDAVARAVDRVASVCARDGAAGHDVRYVQSIFVPGDDTCFCVFRARSMEAVHAVNEAGHFAVDRISAAISLPLANETTSHNKESR